MSDRKGAVTTSLLQKLCHKDDSILLGSWMQDTDHKDVEEQVCFALSFVFFKSIFPELNNSINLKVRIK